MPRLATYFFQQLDIGDRHAPIHRLAHVIDGQQGDLDGGERFHFNSGRTHGLCARLAHHALVADLKVDSHSGQRDGMTQRDQVGGSFAGHDACDARDAEHIPFFVTSGLDQRQRGGFHVDAPRGARDPRRRRFLTNVHHVGLSLGIKMGQGRFGGGGHGAHFIK